MVNVKKGTIIRCDPAMRQFLKHLDETRELGRAFIIKDLDEFRLFVERDIVPMLEQRMDALMDSLTPDTQT
ncbi:hypothetical protein GPALN_014467 [Globodera pallida]|uniref:General transcription and DNA repair factor IIH subunit TFB5 n=1 Tax=Globodera rostochiensis TaxID=31243 RepID=A0A914HPR4_GLORO|nr:hypothetical protein GPALN_014467 [Globodera pallida]